MKISFWPVHLAVANMHILTETNLKIVYIKYTNKINISLYRKHNIQKTRAVSTLIW